MLDFFKADPDAVRWELTELPHDHGFRLAIHHAHGTIHEGFLTKTTAMQRVQQLEDLLLQAIESDQAGEGAENAGNTLDSDR
jgi:hypothetical protein